MPPSGRKLGLTETEVTNQLAYARRTFRRLVLARLRRLTGSEREYRNEVRAVLGAVASRSTAS
jgi:hypothetical protein